MRGAAFWLHGAVLAGGGSGPRGAALAFAPVRAPWTGPGTPRLDRRVSVGGGPVMWAVANAAVAAASEAELSDLTVAELKERLRARRLAVGGRKQALIDRLHDHDNADQEQSSVDSKGSVVGERAEAEVRGRGEDQDRGRDPDAAPPTATTAALPSLTVPALKERLRELGCPVGGRKAELTERLRLAMEEKSGNGEVEVEGEREERTFLLPEVEASDLAATTGNEKEEDSSLLNMLDDLLGDIDDAEDEETPERSSEDGSSRDDAAAASSPGNTGSARRAKKKKYWKSQDVRELVRANDPRAAAKAEEMIAALETMAREEGDGGYLPGPEQYTLLIEAYAKRGTAEALRKAEDVVARLLRPPDAGADAGHVVPPTAPLLNALIAAYAGAGTVDAARKATTVLERMEYLRRFGGTVRPTVHSYAIAISAWARCGSRTAAEEAEVLLRRLLRAYDAAARGEGAGGRAEELTPNNIVFNSVIDAWARSGSPEAGDKAAALLHEMEVLSRTDKYDVRPDTISFNTCIKAFCNSKRTDAPHKAEEILEKLESNPQYPKRHGGALTVRPNRLSYNTVINSWAGSKLPEAAMRAEDILLRMIRAYKAETVATITPDSVTFASVLNALAKSKTAKFKADKCGALLQSMVELHEDDGSRDTTPNVICYNTVLNACAFSAEGTAEERRRALRVAVDTFGRLRRGRHAAPDAVSYGNVLKCCANLVPPGARRNGMAGELFRKCRAEGLVGGMCLDEIRRCVPPEAFLPLLADCGYAAPRGRKAYAVELRELPRSWTRHVKRGDMTSRQRGSFQPRQRQEGRPRPGGKERRPQRQREKLPAVFRRPGLLVEYGSSMKDL